MTKIRELFCLLLLLSVAISVGGCVLTQNPGTDAGNNDAISSDATPVSSEGTGMKTIGVIGGVSWVSSIEYYRLMNEMVMDRLGESHSAKLLMYSVEFGEISGDEKQAQNENWQKIREEMVYGAKSLEAGGADFIIICSNTMHSTVEDIEENVDIPVLHIADATGEKIKEKGIKTVVLLGTKYTMEQDFYHEILEEKYGVSVIVPNETERELINNVIFDELCVNVFNQNSKDEYLKIIDRLIDEEGAEGIILGCTEIPLLVNQDDVDVPVFDTMTIHAEAAVEYALNGTY